MAGEVAREHTTLPVAPQGPIESGNPPGCSYPQSHAVAHDIATELHGVAAQAAACTSFYLDTLQSMSNSATASPAPAHTT